MSRDSFARTEVIDDSEFPVWEEVVDVELPYSKRKGDVRLQDLRLQLVLMDSDPVFFFSDDVLGAVELNL